MSVSDNVNQAKTILGGKGGDVVTLFKLAKRLKGERQFDYARRILARALSNPKVDDDPARKTEIIQQHALCTYKDQDLPAHERFDAALQILKKITNFGETNKEKQETLGLLGAIYKRKWEADGQKLNLERSLLYYLSGHRKGITFEKQGYPSINAAFVLDLLARQEEAEKLEDPRLSKELEGEGVAGDGAATAARRREQANRIRAQIVEKLKDAPKVEMTRDPPGEDGLQKPERKKRT
jgi:hypothetical protein